jgi:membrane-bound metal-dependent hydrolase YbcI (DUF457 family)
MWPWEHAVVGYLVYAMLVIAYRRRPLSTSEAVIVVLGSLLPDLVDKPLAWTFAVLPSGRSLGHSLLTWLAVAGLVVYLGYRLDRCEYVPAFLVGYLLHILADGLLAVPRFGVGVLTFLLWPLLPPQPDPFVSSLVGEFSAFDIRDGIRAVGLCVAGILAHLILGALPWHTIQPEQP